jgi:GAF domain-containing protein
LPLQHDSRLLGVAYADTDDEAKIFSELDADLLEAFAQRASAALAAAEIDSTLSRMESAFADAADGAQKPHDAPAWHESPARRDAFGGSRG